MAENVKISVTINNQTSNKLSSSRDKVHLSWGKILWPEEYGTPKSIDAYTSGKAFTASGKAFTSSGTEGYVDYHLDNSSEWVKIAFCINYVGENNWLGVTTSDNLTHHEEGFTIGGSPDVVITIQDK